MALRRRHIEWRTAPPRQPPGFILPCIPTFAHDVPQGRPWIYEIKHDGYRFLCRRNGARVAVYSRWGVNWSDHVPDIVEAMSALPVRSATIDGEGVVCGPDGISDFERLRVAIARKAARGPFLYAFDLLELDGRDLRGEPWDARRALLMKLLRRAGDGIRLSEHLEAKDGAAVFRHACAMGLEGIVAKRRDRPYRSGRSPDWIKIKNPEAPAASGSTGVKRTVGIARRGVLPI